MSGKEQRRAWILTKLLVGELTVAQAAALMQLSQRQTWRLKVRFERDGPAALIHANRGRASPRRLSQPLRERIVELARGRYAGVNDRGPASLIFERWCLTRVDRFRSAALRPGEVAQQVDAPVVRCLQVQVVAAALTADDDIGEQASGGRQRLDRHREEAGFFEPPDQVVVRRRTLCARLQIAGTGPGHQALSGWLLRDTKNPASWPGSSFDVGRRGRSPPRLSR